MPVSSTGMTRGAASKKLVIPRRKSGVSRIPILEPQSTQRPRSGSEYGYPVFSVFDLVNILDAPNKSGHDGWSVPQREYVMPRLDRGIHV